MDSIILPTLIFILVPGKTNGESGTPFIIPAVAISILNDGDSIKLFGVKFLNHLVPVVPLEADFEDIVPQVQLDLTSLEPKIPAEADFDDTCDVIRRINTEIRSACCMTEIRLNKSCL